MRILAVVAASVGDARLAGLRKAARERALEAVAVRLALGAASLSLGGGVGKRLGSGLHCGDSVIGDRRHRDDHREHDGQKCFVQHLGQISASEREVAGARGGEASRSRDHKQRVACGALEGLGALPAPGPRMLPSPSAHGP